MYRLKVREIMEKLSEFDPEADCFYGRFVRFLDDDFKQADEITDKEWHDVYDIDCEEKTVYHWCHRTQQFIPYTGVIFEVD